MSVLPVPPSSALVSPVRNRWTTPRVLQTALLAIWAAALLFLLAALAAVRTSRSTVQIVGKDAVPSIIAAQKLKVSLSDLDANVVNELMVPPGANSSSIKGYVERRQEITDSLIRAAENITYGDLERKPITDLTNALSAFERLSIKARTLHQRGEERGSIATYRDALNQLHDLLLPAADALAKANTEALNRRETRLNTTLALTTGLTLLSGLLLLTALIATQAYLVKRTGRLLNPALLAATAVSALLLALLLGAVAGVKQQVRIAREDAFASLSALWQARAVAYDANSDESRWLFDTERRPQLEKAFFDKTVLLFKPPAGTSYEAVSAAATAPALPAGTEGYFAKELGNITFPGEQAAAQETVRAYSVYYVKDGKIRSLENAGQHAEAVRFCISLSPGDSNWAYAQYDAALDKTIAINQKAFDTAIETGFNRLKGYDIWLPVALLLVGALTFLGMRPRLREYDV